MSKCIRADPLTGIIFPSNENDRTQTRHSKKPQAKVSKRGLQT
ncbi:MAG: hypothetical protein ACI3XQ_13270 [Eubacteriales bacterium]